MKYIIFLLVAVISGCADKMPDIPDNAGFSLGVNDIKNCDKIDRSKLPDKITKDTGAAVDAIHYLIDALADCAELNAEKIERLKSLSIKK
ncbi:hypothetical protein [Morganella phage Mecenats66]|nr:hypothetical protein [Morganella phage Mecenats66]